MQTKVELIEDLVAEYYEISVAQLKSTKRIASVSLPRQVCMYLLRKYLNFSYKKIGTCLGGKDHSTVLYACHKIEKGMVDSAEVQEALESIQSELKSKGLKINRNQNRMLTFKQ